METATGIFVIDNYDSFTFNLVHLVEQLDVPCVVCRNDSFDLHEVEKYSHVLIGPGPGIPSEAGQTMKLIETFHRTHNIFGVCLGMQALLGFFGHPMENMPQVQHGALATITQHGSDNLLFRDLPRQFRAGRYHSWAFKPESVALPFTVTATSEDGYVMGVEHRSLPLCGVQFHPESIMTEHGLKMVQNWLQGFSRR